MRLDREFLRSITLEQNPFAEEEPDEIRFYDASGTEVTLDDE